MSTGSNNIIVQVTDGVDATIAPKIRDIGAAARDTQTYLSQLQTSLNAVTGNANNLAGAVSKLPTQLNATGASTGRLNGALAQLTGRLLGTEAGFGFLGGTIGRVAASAGVAAPLIAAALSVAAVLGAILIYEKFEESARKLIEAQIALNEHTTQQNTTLLVLHETLIGLTEGPLAKYQAELNDLSKKQIADSVSQLNKLLDDQKSKWATTVSFVERYGAALLHLRDLSPAGIGDALAAAGPKFDIQDAEDFLNKNKEVRSELEAQGQGLKALQGDLAATKAKLGEVDNIEKQEFGRTLDNTKVARNVIHDHYADLLRELAIYNAERVIKIKEANGEILSEQRKQSEQELKAFNDQVNQLKNSTGVVSPQQTLGVRQSQLSQFDTEHPGDKNQASPFAGTRDTLVKDIGAAQQSIDRQNRSLDELVQKYRDEVAGSENYSVALKTEIEQRKAAAEVNKLAPDNVNSAGSLAQINQLIAAKVRDAEVSKEESAIYSEFNEPLLKYNAALEASSRLLTQHVITANEAAIADNKAARAKQDAVNPLNEYVIGLEHEISLLGQYGTALTVATEVDRVRQELQKQGRDLTIAEVQTLTTFLTQLERQKQIQTEINTLYQQNAGAVEKLVNQQLALNQAKEKGVIGDTQYEIGLAKVNVALANQVLLENKTATVTAQLVAGIGKYSAGFEGVAKGLSNAYGQAFTTIADGAANSLGRALAYGENLGKALLNVARQAVSELISGFIKLGIQWLVNEAIAKGVATASLSATAGIATATAAAWAPAAAFASLATLGANAAPAATGISSTVALSESLAALGAFAQGGLVSGQGTGTSDSILAMLSNGEYVVNAQATAQNRALLDQINSGSPTTRPSGSSVGSAGRLQVQVIHDGSTAIRVQQMDDGRVRVIAQQEARQVVQTHGPGIIAADMQNPNSSTSKSVRQNFNITRRR